jgi:hypothetical protein
VLTQLPFPLFPPLCFLQIFIPELNQTFRCPSTFRVFGAQNPLQARGLPLYLPARSLLLVLLLGAW